MSRHNKKQAAGSGSETHLLGRVRVDNIRGRVQEAAADRKADKATMRALRSLERHRDRQRPGTAAYDRAVKQVEVFKDRHGL